MKTETREVYTTDDGKVFEDFTKASTHEAALENEVEIDEFCASLEDSSERAKSRIRNDILKFLAFREMNAVALKEVKADKKVA